MPKPGPGRPRRRCEECRPPEKRRADAPPLSPPAPTNVHRLPAPSAESVARAGPVGATLERLTNAGRESTPEGEIALTLAAALAEGGHTASGLAALAKELRATLAAALEGAPVEPDLVDELKERRARRRGA
ncbi:hypothetical protein ACH45F_38460 [Catenuloplanes sp. NPDC020197]